MKINLLRRISSVIQHFRTITGMGNSEPLLKALEENPDLRTLVSTRQSFDRKYWNQLVTVTDIAMSKGDFIGKPMTIDHYTAIELLMGAQTMFHILSKEILRLNGGVMSTDEYSPDYSPIANLMMVKLDGRYIDNCITVNVPLRTVWAYETNANGRLVLVDGLPKKVQLSGKELNVYFTIK